MGGKLDITWKGPYTITEVAGKGSYHLRAQCGKELKKLYNGVLLKEYFEPPASHTTKPQPQKHRIAEGERYFKQLGHPVKPTFHCFCFFQVNQWIPSLNLNEVTE